MLADAVGLADLDVEEMRVAEHVLELGASQRARRGTTAVGARGPRRRGGIAVRRDLNPRGPSRTPVPSLRASSVRKMAQAVKNHTVSQCYLARWGDASGRLTVEMKHMEAPVLRPPKVIGFQPRFWGDDEQLRVSTEQFLANLEGRAASILRDLPDHWPLDRDDEQWASLLQFVALHLVRTPQWQRDTRMKQANLIAEQMPALRAALRPEALDSLLRRIRSDRYHTELLLGHVPKAASVLGSMHCALLDFGRVPVLTGDHPTVVVPLLRPWESAAIKAIPDGGMLNTIEFRFPVGPRHALLFTWHDQPHPEHALAAAYEFACDLNRATVTQALRELYYRPGDAPPLLRPPFMPAPCRAIGPGVLQGYTTDAALASERRSRADAILRALIEDNVVDQVRTVRMSYEDAA